MMVLLISGCHNESNIMTSDGTKVRLHHLNQPLILVYWDTWCHACVADIKIFNQLYKNDKLNKVKIYGVNFSGLEQHSLMDAIEKMHIDFPVLLKSPKAVINLPAITVVPTLFVISKKGDIEETILGVKSEKEVIDLLQKYAG